MNAIAEKFAFISRHKITADQVRLAADQDIELIPVGDMDAFSASPSEVDHLGGFSGVVVVHPAAALRLASAFLVGVFKNENRAPAGERPLFKAVKLQVYDLRD